MTDCHIPTYADFRQKFGNFPLLILPIKGFWLRKIWTKEKLEEYRNITPYYEKRLEKYKDFPHFPVGFRAGYSMNSAFVICLCKLKKVKDLKNGELKKAKNTMFWSF